MLLQPPNGLDEILATFGDFGLPGWEQAAIVLVPIPPRVVWTGQSTSSLDDMEIKTIRCHRLLSPTFSKVFVELDNFVFRDILPAPLQYSGIYARRNIRGSQVHPSTHSWGIAIDLYPNDYPLGSLKRMPPQVIEMFQDHGFSYGGDFKSRRDPMHFQFANHY